DATTPRAISFAGADGLALRADARGDPGAPPVLFLHGGGQTRHAWGGTAAALARDGRLSITLDLRGHGESDWAPGESPYRLERFAADLRAVLTQIEQKPALVGASLGGLATLLAVGEAPAPIAAAAVLVAGGVVVLDALSNDEAGGPTAAGGGDGPGEPAAAPQEAPDQTEAADQGAVRLANLPRYRESDADYTPADLASLARRLRAEARTVLGQGLAPSAAGFFSAFDPESLPRELEDVYRCVVAEVPPEQLIVPFTIEAASFEDEPAYIASFLQGPAPDQPYDRVVIWVVGQQDCRLRSLASQRL
ncbi:MAG: alpha/beta fold hydrolase, partial [Actinomycetota bacterium]